MNDALKSWIEFWGLLACSVAAETSLVAVGFLVLAALAYVKYCRAPKENKNG